MFIFDAISSLHAFFLLSYYFLHFYVLFLRHPALKSSLDRSFDVSLFLATYHLIYSFKSLSLSLSLYTFALLLSLSKLEFKVTQTSFSFNLLLLTFLFAECVFSRLDGPVSFAAKLGIKLFT